MQGTTAAAAQAHADACVNFISTYGALGDIAPAAFLTDDHWSTLISPAARAELDALTLDELKALLRLPAASFATERPARPSAACTSAQGVILSDLRAFLGEAAQCRLEGLAVLLDQLCATSASVCCDDEEWNSTLRRHRALLGHKKAHEVSRVARLVQWLAGSAEGPLRVVDVGSGKGYLGTFLSVGLGIPTVSVEGSTLITEGAAKRHANVSRLFRRAAGGHAAQHELRTAWLTEAAEADEPRADENEPEQGAAAALQPLRLDGVGDAASVPTRTVLTGLHACGELSSTAVGAFIRQKEELWGLVCVGCCFHLMADGTFPTSRHVRQRGLALSRHARMLASKAVERELSQTAASTPDRTLWRPMLNLLLRDSFGVDVRARKNELVVGKVAHKSGSWAAYARAALAQLGFDPERVSTAELCALEERCTAEHLAHVQKLDVLRLALAPAVESVIALDRLLRVLESDECSAAWIVRMFEPSESPRCLGIVCRR